MRRNILRMGDGDLLVFAPTFSLDSDTRLDMDQWDKGSLSLWVGAPIAMRLDMDHAALERLHSFLGAVLQELDGAAPEAALPAPAEREAICE